MNKIKKITTLWCILLLNASTTFTCISSYAFIPISITHMTTYFYSLKCLTESIHLLSHLHKQRYRYKPSNVMVKKKYIQIDSTLFFHNKTKSCLKEVLLTKSLNPIINLLQEVYYQGNMHDNFFIHEVFLLIFIIHKHILLQECYKHHHSLKKTTLNSILEISDKINQLPIPEVLNAIDMLMTELPPFLEKYELNSAITWRSWLKKYWWVPPVFGGWFSLKILLNLQQSYYYPSRYGYLRPLRQSDTVITDQELMKLTQENRY